MATLMALAPSMATDDDSECTMSHDAYELLVVSARLANELRLTARSGAVLPWKIAFRVQFQSEKFGLRFHPAQFPDTGNGVYMIRLLELTKVQ